MDKYSTRKHLQSFVVVLEYVRAVLAKSETLSERSEFDFFSYALSKGMYLWYF